MNKEITIIGAGLSGCEAALELADKGFQINLIEMRPKINTSAHKTGKFAELVCKNSFGNLSKTSSRGLLRYELNMLGAKLLRIAEKTKISRGEELIVDRDRFSSEVCKQIVKNKNIKLNVKVAKELPETRPLIVATGPLTHKNLQKYLEVFLGKKTLINRIDTSSPIVLAKSLNFEKRGIQKRLEDRINGLLYIPLTKEIYNIFKKI